MRTGRDASSCSRAAIHSNRCDWNSSMEEKLSALYRGMDSKLRAKVSNTNCSHASSKVNWLDDGLCICAVNSMHARCVSPVKSSWCNRNQQAVPLNESPAHSANCSAAYTSPNRLQEQAH